MLFGWLPFSLRHKPNHKVYNELVLWSKKAPGRIPPEALTTLINYIEIFSNVYNRFGLLIINISALCFQLYAFSPQ